jgi:tRNA (mo5U34)-methyltransferase
LNNRENRRKASYAKELAESGGWYHSFEWPDGTVTEGVQTMDHQRDRWTSFGLPDDLTGKRVLDIGAWDGWFGFEAERRGASVTAVDCVEMPNFVEAHRRLNSAVDYRIIDIYDLPEAGLGKFDCVFFLGVLYHVKHPLLALEIVCALTEESAFVSSFVTDAHTWREHTDELPTLEFYETDELGGFMDSWFGPSVSCVLALCRAAGFARVDFLRIWDNHASVACHRKWPAAEARSAVSAELLGVCHARNWGINFNSRREEYLCWSFRWFEDGLRLEDVQLEVGGYGVPTVFLTKDAGERWIANCRLPPGLDAGWTEVSVTVAGAAASNSLRIAVDIPVVTDRVVIAGVTDGFDWTPAEVHLGTSGFLSCWMDGLPENADRNNTRVVLGGTRLDIDFLGELDERGFRQANAFVPIALAEGEYELKVSCGGVESEGVVLRVCSNSR